MLDGDEVPACESRVKHGPLSRAEYVHPDGELGNTEVVVCEACHVVVWRHACESRV